jgi:dihydroorotase
MNYDLVIKNADAVVWNDNKLVQSRVNIAITGDRITKISSDAINGSAQIDATHLTVLPGVIDSQVHFREPGMTHKEDLSSGMLSALYGGVTSIFEMPNTLPPTTNRQAFNDKIELAKKSAWVNYAFFVGGGSENIQQLAELETMKGCPGVKIFMGSSTGTLLVEDDKTLDQILAHTRKRIIVHSEDEYILRDRKQIALDSKNVADHENWRSVESALSSTKRLMNLARKHKHPVHVLHISSSEEMEFLKAQKDLATVEILPQFLTLSAPECYERLGTLAQQNPPIRDHRHLEFLWKAVNNGTVDVMGSDHAPHLLSEKQKPYPTSPSGMPGVQTMVPVMLNHVHNKKLSLLKFVELVGEGPRKTFGCLNKGRIADGMDADLTLVDLKKQFVISNSDMKTKTGWTPFDGMTVTGQVHSVLINGKWALQENQHSPMGKGTLVEFTP